MAQDRSGKRPPRADHKATVFPHRRGRRDIDSSRPPDDTTPLILCREDDVPSDHRGYHDDHVGRHSGRWIIPLLGLGVSFWVMLGMALFGDGEGPRDTPSVFATTQLS